jgi:hypothetical protein
MAHGPEIIEEGLPSEKKRGTVDPSTIQAHPNGQEEVKKDVVKPKRMPLAQVINLYDFEVSMSTEAGVATAITGI